MKTRMKPAQAKALPECVEGPEAYQRFDTTVTKLLTVAKETLLEREKQYRKQVDANPRRRGPKRKAKTS